jgi:hypothetical protein
VKTRESKKRPAPPKPAEPEPRVVVHGKADETTEPMVVLEKTPPTSKKMKSGDHFVSVHPVKAEEPKPQWVHRHRGVDLEALVRIPYKGFLRDPENFWKDESEELNEKKWQYGDPFALKQPGDHDPITRGGGEPDARRVEDSARYWLRRLEASALLPRPELKSLGSLLRSLSEADTEGWKALRERLVLIHIERCWKPKR